MWLSTKSLVTLLQMRPTCSVDSSTEDDCSLKPPFFGWGVNHIFIHTRPSKLAMTKCLKNFGRRLSMSLWLWSHWVISERSSWFQHIFSKHECMLKPSAQSNIILRPFGNHGYLTRVELWCHLPHHLQRWMPVTVHAMSYCVTLLWSNLLCTDRENTYICDYHAAVSKYNCLQKQDGTKLTYISEGTK